MKKILVVDDDVNLRSNLAQYLMSRGYLVQEAASGVEGVVLFEQQPFDLIVSDITMPEMDGFEFCRHLRANRAGQLIPFLFLSGREEIEDRIQGHAIGADDYLKKPFEPRELIAKIETQLERSQRTHAEIL
ncbi:DNA-binding response regulator, partial [Leptolyngbya sp. 'hensonii']|uniref:response regulator transcription factor n=1 Tax=Leptolyngbya sp. 'hensonii' TaxID=1922337 RepID=UPI0009664A23